MEDYVFISKQSSFVNEVYGLEKLRELEDAEIIPFDFETTGLDVFTLRPILLGLHGNGISYVINLLTFTEKEIKQALTPLLDKLWVAHNVKYDLKILLYHYGVRPENVWCTQLASQVLYNGTSFAHTLAACLERHFNVFLDKTVRNLFIDRDLTKEITLAEIEYLTGDLKYLVPLMERQKDVAKLLEQQNCIDLENRYVYVLAKLELNGVTIDKERWMANTIKYQEKLDIIEKELRNELTLLNQKTGCLKEPKIKKAQPKNQIAMFDMGAMVNTNVVAQRFNFGSSSQVKDALVKAGAKIDSTEEGSLNAFTNQYPEHVAIPFIKKLLEHREMAKLISTYGQTFLDKLNPVTGKMHTNYNQCFAVTGRLSSSGPNLQNIPASEEIRACFIPDSQEYDFVTCDMSGQEIRIAASYSQDAMLLASLNEGLDLHSTLAQDSFRIIKHDPELVVSQEVNSSYRKKHKPILFGYIYGAGAKRIADVLNIDMVHAAQVFAKLKLNLKTLDVYLERVKAKVLREEKVYDQSKYNRIKHYNWHVTKPTEQHNMEKEGVNFAIQATGASMMKEAGIEIQEWFDELWLNERIDCRIKLQVHDEYVFQIPKGRTDIANRLKAIMEEVGDRFLTGCKMESSMEICDHWKK